MVLVPRNTVNRPPEPATTNNNNDISNGIRIAGEMRNRQAGREQLYRPPPPSPRTFGDHRQHSSTTRAPVTPCPPKISNSGNAKPARGMHNQNQQAHGREQWRAEQVEVVLRTHTDKVDWNRVLKCYEHHKYNSDTWKQLFEPSGRSVRSGGDHGPEVPRDSELG